MHSLYRIDSTASAYMKNVSLLFIPVMMSFWSSLSSLERVCCMMQQNPAFLLQLTPVPKVGVKRVNNFNGRLFLSLVPSISRGENDRLLVKVNNTFFRPRRAHLLQKDYSL